MKVRRIVGLGVAAASVCAVGLVWTARSTVSAADAVVFTVNSASDAVGARLTCATTAGGCTLRAALTAAHSVTAAPVRVEFAIPGTGVHTIQLTSRLPLIDNQAQPITIDGFTQAGSSPNTNADVDTAKRTIDLVGTGAAGIEGLVITSPRNVIRGLVMRRFSRAVRMTGSGADFNQLIGNSFGLLPSGGLDPTYASIVGSPCIDINSGASQNRIGTPAAADRNVISGCYEKGITFYNEFTYKNVIQNNIIGLDPTGVLDRGNGSMGIDVNWSTNATIIGGTGPHEHNVISGNQNSGVEISHGTGTVNNRVIGNYIGTDYTGNRASSATKNNDFGVRLEGKPDCGANACTIDAGHETVTNNVIVNSGSAGVFADKGMHDSVISDNQIGRTLNGTVANNGTAGVRIAAGATHIVVGPGNTFAGTKPAVEIWTKGFDPVSAVVSPTEYNTVTQNSIITTGVAVPINLAATAGDPNVNEGIVPPGIVVLNGQISAATCAGCVVEVFTATTTGAAGPGRSYISSSTANASGVAVLNPKSSGWPAIITATTTTPNGSTSEFAVNTPTGTNTGPTVSPPPVSAPPPTIPLPPPTDPPTGPPTPPTTPAPVGPTPPINGGATAGVPARRIGVS